jgi:hypothetical protein
MAVIQPSLHPRTLTALAAVALGASLLVVASPASASDSGLGAGAGKYQYDSVGVQQDPPCGEFDRLLYNHDLESIEAEGFDPQGPGVFAGSVTIDGETYRGPFTVQFENNEGTDDVWYANPDGLYAPDDPTCGGDGDYKVDLTNVRVVSPTTIDGNPPDRDEAGISCGGSDNNNGKLQRSQQDIPEVSPQADIADLKANCTVSDGDPGDRPEGRNNVSIDIQSTFAGPCWRTSFPFAPIPPEECVTEDIVEFHA